MNDKEQEKQAAATKTEKGGAEKDTAEGNAAAIDGAEKPKLGPIDPFDPVNLGIPSSYAAAINAQSSSKPYELRKPNDQEYFRTSAVESHCVRVGAIADKQDMGRVYVVSGAVLDEVIKRFPKSVRGVELVLTMSLVGVAFVWPVPLAEDRGGQWNSTQRDAKKSGVDIWTNMAPGRGRYDLTTVNNPKAVDWAAFPPFREILRQACAERFIDSLDHLLLRKLAGNNE
jgi:hypothetical protein